MIDRLSASTTTDRRGTSDLIADLLPSRMEMMPSHRVRAVAMLGGKTIDYPRG